MTNSQFSVDNSQKRRRWITMRRWQEISRYLQRPWVWKPLESRYDEKWI